MNSNSRVLKTKGNKITSRFGKRTITYTSGPAKGQKVTKNHNGIDIVGTGSTLDDIVAHSAGTVQAAGFDSACGYYVNILTDSGATMVYYHMAKGSLQVKTGDKVKQGQTLGYMGATGNVTGAHLHFGIKVNGAWIDPEPYVNADFEPDELTVDGIWGTDTTKRLQKIFNTVADGVVSNQPAAYKATNPGLTTGWDWQAKPNGKGSALIRTMQAWAGMPAGKRNGILDPDTVKAIQTKLRTPADGKVSKPSAMVKALQEWANKQN